MCHVSKVEDLPGLEAIVAIVFSILNIDLLSGVSSACALLELHGTTILILVDGSNAQVLSHEAVDAAIPPVVVEPAVSLDVNLSVVFENNSISIMSR